MSLRPLVCLALVAASAPAAAEVREHDLVEAVQGRDRDQIARVAAHAGPARLARWAASPRPETSRAALIAAGEIDEGWTLLPIVVEQLATADGARAAASIAHRLRDPLFVELHEVDADVLDTARRRCTEAAASAALPGAIRADLLACAADLGEPAARSYLFDPAPEVRAAAISLLAGSADRSWRRAVEDAARSTDATTAAPALAALCIDDARATLAVLDGPGRERLRALVTAGGDATLIIALRLCLRASDDPKDRAALRRPARPSRARGAAGPTASPTGRR